MKQLYKTLLLAAFIAVTTIAFGQDREKAKQLVKQGIVLHDSTKYDQAIALYNEAIKADPGYYSAYYEMAYTLSIQDKPKEALPYLEKAVAIDPTSGESYNLLGNIYDDDGHPDKAIEYYKKGIAAEPDYQRLHFNIAITYYKQQQYALAEESALMAVKLDAKHASSHRIFAMATNKQGKLGTSLLGWCNFLLIEPQTKRSPEAVGYVKAIINNGVKRTGSNEVTISMNSKDMSPAKLLMPLAVTNATSGKTGLSATDSLTLQLTKLFEVAHTIGDDKEYPMVANYYAGFFQELARSGNMAAFTRYIMLSTYKQESLVWFKEHDKELTAFDTWLTATKREF